MNEERLNKYYQEIASQLNKIIPIEWERIVMYGEELGNVSGVSFYFYSKENGDVFYSGNISEDFNVDRGRFKCLLRELRGSIKNLWNAYKEENENSWCTITFELMHDWNFRIKFGYELDDNIGSFEREIIWAYSEYGIVPKGEFARLVLEEWNAEKR